MSIIAVATDGERCCMGSDSAKNLDGLVIPGRSKLVRQGDLLFGAVGPTTISQFLIHRLPHLMEPKLDSDIATLAHGLAEVLRRDHRERELMEKDRDGGLQIPGTFFVARGPQFVVVDGGGSVIELDSSFWAIGSGDKPALGAMSEAHSRGVDVGLLVSTGLKAACRFDDGCRGPLYFEWTAQGGA